MDNPKAKYAAAKVPIHLWPNTATIEGCLALHEGALKYGRSNYRATYIKATDYYSATRRHFDSWFEGQDIDPDSGLKQLGKAIACLAVLIDAIAAGRFIDDRQYPGGYQEAIADATPHVARLNEQHKDKNPKHYSRSTSESLRSVVSIVPDEDFYDD